MYLYDTIVYLSTFTKYISSLVIVSAVTILARLNHSVLAQLYNLNSLVWVTCNPTTCPQIGHRLLLMRGSLIAVFRERDTHAAK